MEIKDLLNHTDKLPNVPEVVLELVQALNSPNTDYSEIAQKVAKDPIISLKILRLVNSAHFGLNREVASIEEAVVMLGMSKLKTLVIASGFANSASQVEGLDLPAFWSKSFHIAEIAKSLAELTEGEVDPESAFTCGVICNIGQLLLHMTQANRAMAIKTLVETSGVSRSEAELERLGFTSADAAQALLEQWKLPGPIVSAIKYQNDPAQLNATAQLAAVLYLAKLINRESNSEDEIETIISRVPSDIVALAGIDQPLSEFLPRLLAVESGLDSLAA